MSHPVGQLRPGVTHMTLSVYTIQRLELHESWADESRHSEVMHPWSLMCDLLVDP